MRSKRVCEQHLIDLKKIFSFTKIKNKNIFKFSTLDYFIMKSEMCGLSFLFFSLVLDIPFFFFSRGTTETPVVHRRMNSAQLSPFPPSDCIISHIRI